MLLDPLLGGAHPGGSPGPLPHAAPPAAPLTVVSVKVTQLTAARLSEVLKFPCVQGAGVVCLHETRHVGNAAWARRAAFNAGWHSTFSAPPPAFRAGGFARSNGGTAVLWRPVFGRACPVSLPSHVAHTPLHRAVAFSTAAFSVVSVYGHAQKPDLPWMHHVLSQVDSPSKAVFVIGDWNWKPAHDNALPSGWRVSAPIPTTVAQTAITRAVANAPVSASCMSFLPGIPHHGAVVFSCNTDAPAVTPAVRFRKCAAFSWPSRSVIASDSPIAVRLNHLFPPAPVGASLPNKWVAWHARAEGMFSLACEAGFASRDVPAERPKGSVASVRPRAPGPSHRCQETVAARRLKRLHRTLSELCHSHPNSLDNPVPAPTWRRLRRAEQSGLLVLPAGVVILPWKKRFRQWSSDIWPAAGNALRPSPTIPCFTASDMREDWEAVWCPDSVPVQPANAWVDFAFSSPGFKVSSRPSPSCLLAGNGSLEPPEDTWPTLEVFLSAVDASDGSAGFDGWHSSELRALHKHAPFLLEELYHFDTSRAENIPDFNLWDWKTVGIPKRTSLDSRPISVASVLVRAWHKALLSLFPEQPQSQWAGRRGVSCLHAIAAFLATPKTGVDLSKAFDTVDHSVADIAMQTHGIHRRLRQILLRAWKAPRHCVVGGVPSLPINPLRGLPQGDPVAPAVLGMVLAPWCGDSCHDEQRFAFVDDRTIVAQGDRPTEHLAEAIQCTAGSDEAIGISENRAKRQLWVSGQDHPIEHLGLRP